MKDLRKLFGQGLLSLQVLHGSVRWARQRLQQAAQGILCKDKHTSALHLPDRLSYSFAQTVRLWRRFHGTSLETTFSGSSGIQTQVLSSLFCNNRIRIGHFAQKNRSSAQFYTEGLILKLLMWPLHQQQISLHNTDVWSEIGWCNVALSVAIIHYPYATHDTGLSLFFSL